MLGGVFSKNGFGPLGKIGIILELRTSFDFQMNVYVSENAGKSWKKINEDRKLRQRAFYYSRIYADPKDENTVYALNTGFYKSTDGGKTFDKKIKVPHGDNHDLWIDPNNPLRMVNANEVKFNLEIFHGS